MPQTQRNIAPMHSAVAYQVLFAPAVVFLSPKQNFEMQVETLKEKGLARYADADSLRGSLVELKRNSFLFVPPPPAKLDLRELMAKVVVDGRKGESILEKASGLADIAEYPKTACLLLGVDGGQSYMKMNSSASHNSIVKAGRHPFGVWMGVVFAATFPGVLKQHSLYLVGTRYARNFVPELCICSRHKRPELCYQLKVYTDPEGGAPSAERIILP